jgi:hypothetical protein
VCAFVTLEEGSMQSFHISDTSRSLPLRGIHALSALTLAITLITGLGCDENAPTETRAPAGSTELADGDAPDLAVGDITTQAIALPVNQSVATTAPAPAFRVNQTGTGPNGIFQISRSGNTQTALQGLTNGRGRAGFFRIQNSANTGPALESQTNGSGFAIEGLALGLGGAGGLFAINSTSNSNAALTAATNGQGNAGLFRINNVNNTTSAVQGVTFGRGGGVNGIATASGGTGGIFTATHVNGFALNAANSGGGVGGIFATYDGTINNYALRAVGNPNFSPKLAAYLDGNVTVTGTLTKGGGSFKIDHPLDPEHKYLSHSFVESPDMMNVYNGNVALDENGRATVELPYYFEALNRDFRYQLTAVGAPGPNLYIAEGVKQNSFRIAGGRPYASVSWQVTGIRQDTYANEHRIKVEEDKPAEEKSIERLVARR